MGIIDRVAGLVGKGKVHHPNKKCARCGSTDKKSFGRESLGGYAQDAGYRTSYACENCGNTYKVYEDSEGNSL